MREQIAVKKNEIRREKMVGEKVGGEETKGMDVFTRLTRANEEESRNGLSMSDDELVCDLFCHPIGISLINTDRECVCDALW
jgi:hypothetical protein